ncbi:MAG: ATP-grasp domain-containing protein [Planctomycetia bacterium]|nr:ATP-grasp domain-containing protein [Planctomycetia bacterium]
MKIFVYEFVTGGGWSSHMPPDGSLSAEARAMVQAMAADFAALEGVEVLTTRDARLPELHPAGCDVTLIASSDQEHAAFCRLVRDADWTLLIAPESGGALLERCRLVEEVGGWLLSPSSDCIAIASSKQATAERLRSAGFAVPRGARISAGRSEVPSDLAFPVVIKPDDGCGSQGVRLLTERGRESFPRSDYPDGSILLGKDSRPLFRIEEFVCGLAASVSVLCGPAGNHALPACQQLLSEDGQFTYRGGRLPLPSSLDARARKLALAAVEALPEPRGYIGVDLILGEADDGIADYVIEINPRLTTSYVGLRALARTNLAAAMLAVVSGQSPNLCFGTEQVEFTADGTIVKGAEILVCQK